MTTVVIEHVALNDLPDAWRARLPLSSRGRVTVRIEEEADDSQSSMDQNPLFGMWKNREETADVVSYARQLRAPRYHVDDPRPED